jgi:hypothetical protein
MGLPATNAGLGTAQNIGGNRSWQPQAIEAKNNFLQGLVEGGHQLRNIQDRVGGFSGNPNPAAVNAVRGAFNNNFDPRIYALNQAQARGPEDLKTVMGSVSPAEAKTIAAKRKNLQLLEAGQMPQ